jgi:hypothetical protein
MTPMRRVMLLLGLMTVAQPVFAQGLYLQEDERAIEAGAAWSVGASSNGTEFLVSVSPASRVDAGLMIARYTYTFEDGSKSTFKEYAPFVRLFPVKETQDGAPVSLAVSGQLFLDDYAVEGDSGRYVQIGTTVYKNFQLSSRFALQPFVGFAFVAESYAFGGGDPDRAQYLTRDIGLHFTTATDRPWFLRMTLAEQSFRRETYRGARIALIHRLWQ